MALADRGMGIFALSPDRTFLRDAVYIGTLNPHVIIMRKVCL
jgi:hypothetical protein